MVFDLLLVATLIGANPLAIGAFIVLLDSKNGIRKGAAFVFGWLVSLAVVIAATNLLTNNRPPASGSSPSDAGLAVKLAIGVALIVVAVRQQRRRGKPKKTKKTPRWQQGVDDMSVWWAGIIAFLIQPWGLVAVSIASVMEAKLSSAATYLVIVLYCLIATWSYLAMEIYAGFRPEQVSAMLAKLRAWMSSHTDQVIIIASLSVGFWLIGQSTYLLVS